MFRRLLISILLLAFACPVFAQEAVQLDVTLDPTITVTLEGETSASSVYVTQDGEHYLDAAPILEALDDEVVFDTTENVLMVTRSQDGVTMSLYTDTGLVQADGKDLGKLKTFGKVGPSQYLLNPNTIAVLSGAKGKFNTKTNGYSFELDPRLRVATGFDITVEGENLLNVSPEPKSIGPVLLLPLLPIAKALGSDVQVVEGGNVVQVRRVQDSALFSMDLSSGLISLNGNPRGVARNVTYIDPVNLLLPSTAVEALTGTHVNVKGASTLIEITLDDRLGGGVKPGERVDDAVADTPFTMESLQFDIGLQQLNEVSANFHVREFNGRVRYEMPDLPTSIEEAQPSWLSLDFAHVGGVSGSVGDISATRRETQSVGATRLQGVKVGKTLKDGRWSAVLGMPSRGTERVSDRQSRLDFGGFAGGMRYQDADGWEVGFAAAHDDLTRDQKAVLSLISNRLNLTKDDSNVLSKVDVAASLDIGLFNGPVRERTPDLRFSTAASLDISEALSVDAFARYDGVEFLRTDLDQEDEQREITNALVDGDLEDDEEFVPDLRRRGTDRADYGVSIRGSLEGNTTFRRPTASLRAEQTVTGLTVSEERSTLTRLSMAAGTTFGESGVNFSADATAYEVDSDTQATPDDRGFQLGARLYKRFDDMTLSGDYRLSDSDKGRRLSIASAQVTTKPQTLNLPRGAKASLGPVAGATLVNGKLSGQGGMTARMNSGALFGERNRVSASLGLIQSVSARGESRTTRYLSVDFDRQLPIGRNLALGVGARTDLSGDIRVGLQLRGRYDFNESRRYSRTENERGVLSGIAFLDTNRDGIRQPEERGLPGVGIKLHSTPYKLRAGAAGAYTIQNLKQGLYEVRIDARTLPLGYAQSEDTPNRASIAEGRITRLDLPVVPRGQIRGSVFEDANGDGEYQRGEARPEGVRLTLIVDGEEMASVTSSFGQFAFDDLPSGTYQIRRDGVVVREVDLGEHDDLLAKVKVALPLANEDTKNTKEDVVSPEPIL